MEYSRKKLLIFDLSDNALNEHIKIFSRIKFNFIYGYTNALVLFARYLIKNDLIFLDGLVISLNGKNYIRSSAKESIKDWNRLSDKLSKKFFNQGVEEILNEIRNASS